MKDHLEIKTTVAKIKNPIKEFKNQIERNKKCRTEIQKKDNTKCWQECGVVQTFIHCM